VQDDIVLSKKIPKHNLVVEGRIFFKEDPICKGAIEVE